jgi:diadenosine tetraphosphate (Ap4A) HIT family hydrolase
MTTQSTLRGAARLSPAYVEVLLAVAGHDFYNDCDFCAIARGESLAPENMELMGDNGVLVVPALGPLEVGHTMLLTRGHYMSFASAPSEVRLAAVGAIRRLEALMGVLLLAEHGMTSSEAAGGCITHAHMNLVPIGTAPPLNLMLEALGTATLDKLGRFNDIPYLSIGTSATSSLTIYDALGLKSQYFRRIYCGSKLRSDWDWILYPKHDLVKETISRVLSRP